MLKVGWLKQLLPARRRKGDVFGSVINRLSPDPLWHCPCLSLVPSLAPSTHSSMVASSAEAYQIFTLTFSNVYIIYFRVHKIFTCHAKYTSYFCCAVLFLLYARDNVEGCSPRSWRATLRKSQDWTRREMEAIPSHRPRTSLIPTSRGALQHKLVQVKAAVLCGLHIDPLFSF